MQTCFLPRHLLVVSSPSFIFGLAACLNDEKGLGNELKQTERF